MAESSLKIQKEEDPNEEPQEGSQPDSGCRHADRHDGGRRQRCELQRFPRSRRNREQGCGLTDIASNWAYGYINYCIGVATNDDQNVILPNVSNEDISSDYLKNSGVAVDNNTAPGFDNLYDFILDSDGCVIAICPAEEQVTNYALVLEPAWSQNAMTRLVPVIFSWKRISAPCCRSMSSCRSSFWPVVDTRV